MHQAAGRPVDGVGGAHDRQTQRSAVLAAELYGGRAERLGDRLLSRVGSQRGADLPVGAPEGVHRLGDDTVRGDARHQGGTEVRGQRVVRADPAAPGGALAGVDDESCLFKPLDTLGDGRLGDAGPGGDLRPGEPGVGHQDAQHVLVRQSTQQFQGRFRRGHTTIPVRTLA